MNASTRGTHWLLALCAVFFISTAASAQGGFGVGDAIYVDFGFVDYPTPGNWNNMTAVWGGLENLVTGSGIVTEIDLSLASNFANPNQNGTTEPDPALGLPLEATRDSFYGNDVAYWGMIVPTAQVVISGLEPSSSYELAIFSSRMDVSDNRQTQFTLSGIDGTEETLLLNPANNTSTLAVSSAIVPTADGEIVIDVQKGPENDNSYGFYYLGALVLRTLENPAATQPDPADGATGASIDAALSWVPGTGAVTHNIYFGTDAVAVANAEVDNPLGVLVSQGQAASAYLPAPALAFDQPYYWRVDEVQADMTVQRGQVWTFTTALGAASAPAPADGAVFINPEQVELAWTAGWGSVSHDVYFGTDATDVTNGTGGTFQGNQTETTFSAGQLQRDVTYYWRVDEILGDGGLEPGALWSFATIPSIDVTDPTLVAWWKLDEGAGTTVVDWSGHGHHGTLSGQSQWVSGLFGGALDLEYDNTEDGAIVPGFDVESGGISLAAWVRPESFSQHDGRIVDKGIDVTSADHAWWMLGTNEGAGGVILRFRLKTTEAEATTTLFAETGTLTAEEWTHAAAIWDGTSMVLYKDGIEVGKVDKGGDAVAVNPDARVYIGNEFAAGGRRPWDGILDDIRVYNKGLTEDELKEVMRGDPLQAWDPIPYNGAVTDAIGAATLTWQPGDGATGHDVYLGADRLTVQAANASDTTGIYRGRQNAASYTPDPALDWDQEYFWRVDEIDNSGTTSPGYVWSFTLADYLIVDDFERYTDDEDAGLTIWQSWTDGLDDTSNGGSQVGHPESIDGTFGETTIVHGGWQSMNLFFDNSDSPMTSEVDRVFDAPQDWTWHGLNTLLMYVHGRLPVGSVAFDSGAQRYTLIGAGSNVWGTRDEFHFAHKQLSGNGSITIRVDSIMDNPPHGDPRIGVMMRDTLDPASANATVFVEPDPRTRLTARLRPEGDTESIATLDEGDTPTWIRLTREGYAFRAEKSDDGVTFTSLGDEASIFMTDPVYVGLVVCSHASGQFIEATVSNVTTVGNITPAGPFTTSEDIGIASNTPQPLYVGLQDSAGNTAFVTDADLVTTNEWTLFSRPFSDFTGVNPAAIKTLTIGVGDRDNPTPGGSGVVYVDNVRLISPPAVDPGPDGLIAHYAFEGNTDDSSANGLHGAASGDPVYSVGPAGNGSAMDFDGADDVVDLGQFDIASGGITLAAWIKPDDFEISDARIISKATEWAGDSHWWMMSTQAETQLRFRLKTDEGPGTTTLVSTDPAVLETGVWMHVAATWDGTTMRIYRDGVEVGSLAKGGTAVAVDPTVSVAIGSQPSDAYDTSPSHTAKFFDGMIDEVRIYNRALSDTELQYLVEN